MADHLRPVARSAPAGSSHNTLALADVRIRFQIAPGVATGLGIAGLPYRVERQGGGVVHSGSTNADGEILFEVLAVALDDLVLVVMDTRFAISTHDPPSSMGEHFAAWKKRLQILGYYSGYLTDAPAIEDIEDVDVDEDSSPLQLAIMNFQLDRLSASRGGGMHLDGELDTATRNAIRDDLGEPQGRR